MMGNSDDPALTMATLGRFHVEVQGKTVQRWGAGRSRELLQYACLHAGEVMLSEVLKDDLWPDGDPGSSSLRVAVHAVRRILGKVPGINLVSRPGGYELVVDGLAMYLDALEFARLCERAREAVRNSDDRSALHDYSAAIEIYQGDLLPDNKDSWAVALQQRYRSWALDALAHLYADAVSRGNEDELLKVGRKIIEIDAYNEQCYRDLITVLRRRDQMSLAWKWYRTCMVRLAELNRTMDQRTVQIMHS